MLVSKVRERVTWTAGLPSRSWGETVRVVASRWVWGLKFMVNSLIFGSSSGMAEAFAENGKSKIVPMTFEKDKSQ